MKAILRLIKSEPVQEVQHVEVWPQIDLVAGQTLSRNPLNLFANISLKQMYRNELPKIQRELNK